MAQSILKGTAPIIAKDRPDFGVVQQAEKDLKELEVIVHVLQPTPARQQQWSRFQRMFGGPALPSETIQQDKARDTQFELFTEAILERSGLAPSFQEHDEPDFQCQMGERKFVVEAKRVSKIARLDDRFRDAANQIADSGLPGVVFIDYSEAVNPGDKILAFESPQDDSKIHEAIQNRWHFFWNSDEGRSVRNRAQGKGVLGAVFFDHVIAQNGLAPNGEVGHWGLWTIRDHVKLIDSALTRSILQVVSDLGLPSE